MWIFVYADAQLLNSLPEKIGIRMRIANDTKHGTLDGGKHVVPHVAFNLT